MSAPPGWEPLGAQLRPALPEMLGEGPCGRRPGEERCLLYLDSGAQGGAVRWLHFRFSPCPPEARLAATQLRPGTRQGSFTRAESLVGPSAGAFKLPGCAHGQQPSERRPTSPYPLRLSQTGLVSPVPAQAARSHHTDEQAEAQRALGTSPRPCKAPGHCLSRAAGGVLMHPASSPRQPSLTALGWSPTTAFSASTLYD